MIDAPIQHFIQEEYPFRWEDLNVEHIPAALDYGLQIAKERVEALEKLPVEEVSYDSFMQKLEDSDDELGRTWSIAHTLASVDDSQAIRDILEKYTPILSEFGSYTGQSVPLYERTKALADSDEFATLTPLQQRCVTQTLKGFVRSGAALDEAKKKELTEIGKEMGLLEQKFEQNVLDETNGYEKIFPLGSEDKELKGLPESALNMAKASAKQAGKEGYRFTLQRPSVSSVLTYADDRNLREEIWRAYNNMCSEGKHSNMELLPKILELREREAKLLGFENYAEYVVELRMLNTPQKILDFTNELYQKAKPLDDADFEMLVEFAQKKKAEAGDQSEFDRWDAGYYAEKLTQEKLGLSAEELRPYFEFNASLASIFSLCETIYSVEFKKIEGHKAWHESVDYYEMYDKESGRLIAGFYTDFFPRKEKRGGAWMDGMLVGRKQADGTLSPHVGFIGGNFNPPSDDTPSLLSHYELTTLFHEFGHLLHLMMTTVEIPSMAGTSVTWDFVELPSQLMENYCYDSGFLKSFAKHYKTGEVISDELIAKIQKDRSFMGGTACMRQLGFASLDMYLHTTPASEFTAENIEEKLKVAQEKYLREYPTPAKTMAKTFTHLFGGGYAAGYYSYKWSEILEADVWEKFEEDGIMNPATGKAWREGIISRGDSQEAMDLFKAYRGREPSMQPYIRKLTGEKR